MSKIYVIEGDEDLTKSEGLAKVAPDWRGIVVDMRQVLATKPPRVDAPLVVFRVPSIIGGITFVTFTPAELVEIYGAVQARLAQRMHAKAHADLATQEAEGIRDAPLRIAVRCREAVLRKVRGLVAEIAALALDDATPDAVLSTQLQQLGACADLLDPDVAMARLMGAIDRKTRRLAGLCVRMRCPRDATNGEDRCATHQQEDVELDARFDENMRAVLES